MIMLQKQFRMIENFVQLNKKATTVLVKCYKCKCEVSRTNGWRLAVCFDCKAKRRKEYYRNKHK